MFLAKTIQVGRSYTVKKNTGEFIHVFIYLCLFEAVQWPIVVSGGSHFDLQPGAMLETMERGGGVNSLGSHKLIFSRPDQLRKLYFKT